MTILQPFATGGSASFVTDQWRTMSLATVWRHPGDWHAIAASGLVSALLAGEQVREPAAALGGERARQGVSLTESLNDLSVLFRIVSDGEPPSAASTSFSSSWADVTTADLLTTATIDPRTGLTTRQYLVPRVRELYAEATARGVHPNDERCLIVAQNGAATGWRRVMREGKAGRVFTAELDGGQTNSILLSGTVLSLAGRDDALDEHVVRIRRGLSRDEPEGFQAPIVRIQSLPATVAEAEQLLLVL